MGCCITMEESNLKIVGKDNIEKVSELIIKNSSSFRWCDSVNENDENLLVDIFEAIRYDIEEVIENDQTIEVKIIDFLGEKYGNEEEIFNLLAPYLEDGYIQFYTDYGETFRLVVKDGVCEWKTPKMIWE